MKHAGQLCWIRSGFPSAVNVIGLVMPYDDPTHSFVISATNDVRLAGHLDPILPPRSVGVPFALAILTHVGAWIATDRLTPTGGELEPFQVAEVEGARAGVVPPTLAVGRRLYSPELEPRWPLIESHARAWLSVAQYDPESVGA